LRVTFIGTLPPIKGMSPYCLELVTELSKYAEVEFIGFKKLYPDFLYPGGTKVDDDSYKTPAIENMKIRDMLTYYNPFTWVWAGLTAKGDIVHAQWWSYVLAPVYITVLLILKVRRKKTIITVHNVSPHEGGKLNRMLNSIVLRFGDAFIVHDAVNGEKLGSMYGFSEGRIYVVPMGIFHTEGIETFTKHKAREYLHISEDREVILCFGNIREYKGLDVLLEALSLVIKERGKALLLIAGQPWLDWQKYEDVIKQKHLGDHVVTKLDFISPSEVGYYFSSADIVVLSHKYSDAQSAVGALALPFAKPMVVTRVGGLPELVDDEAAIAEPGNAEDLAQRIINILGDRKLLKKLAKDSETLALKYNWDSIIQKTIEAYEGVLK
jgi:glycosyltransferase involved in cell wall biosynthesis